MKEAFSCLGRGQDFVADASVAWLSTYLKTGQVHQIIFTFGIEVLYNVISKLETKQEFEYCQMIKDKIKNHNKLTSTNYSNRMKYIEFIEVSKKDFERLQELNEDNYLTEINNKYYYGRETKDSNWGLSVD